MRALALVAALIFVSPVEANAVTVFAASSTQHVVDRILTKCPQTIGRECRVAFAASSSLARQIDHGAPANVYLSANARWMDYLADRGKIMTDTRRDVASNRLVVIMPVEQAVAIDSIAELQRQLTMARVAGGDPSHVPAGIYAEQALRHLGLWSAVSRSLLRMPNVRAALNVVARAEVHAGLVYASDARVSNRVTAVYTFAAETHDPIVYPVAVVAEAIDDEAILVRDLFLSIEGQAVFADAGFTPLGHE